MIAEADMEVCRELIRTGSYSFHAASRVLPARVRDPALALYAFCRVADDEVDEVGAPRDKAAAVLKLGDRLEDIYAGRPRNAPSDRAFAAVVEEFEMPRELPEALLEGFAWDAEGRWYHTLSDVQAYSARVAAAVGAMMCVLMRVRNPDALARACDLGLAMQMSNIARDVGEDARAGRLFLPTDWMVEEGIDPQAFLADPQPTKGIRRVTERLLNRADRLYWRAATGVRLLPFDCRPGIMAAGKIYAAIGAEVAKAKYDNITRRAHTTKGRKLWLVANSAMSATATSMLPLSPRVHAKPEPEVAHLVDAAAHRNLHPERSEVLISALMALKARDRGLAMD
ncbi:15-cis-phytoene synthase [Rhodobacter capsulatus]|uniref:Phytoene synthase n=1 Tax=Rhodobacter capsulatus (strain ATCC BAA-309 / NBRC 16581 / SB1003) TaxID=272942 RepID=CRTB_RHOCB|nr:phytoene/squalene synthase family protein [Rhodobacter capsulatus]P17056.1 RecName: Full=Phytoene synthase; Short=PSase [Rhodobacter capsulatus SB 1003]ADE84445.1 phytoene synthase [Rhodobacter capsulatus SB 1003]ETD82507.1 phytoene synthase [Rhodobacter capsulatus YW1]ETD82970.1 phytoene synthase [Rhodobacter capsulatus B6]ETD89526.1 phytoene synthase [Rhodobacter capsulatus YW2]MDS0926191.1 phytoene/squalene synthase family protein [Rhodobacter capsulatus]